MTRTDWFATFKVRQASTLAGLAAVLVVAGVMLGVLSAVVATQPGVLERGDWFWLALAGFAALGGGAVCFVVSFVTLCVNVEYIAREAVDRRGGGQ